MTIFADEPEAEWPAHISFSRYLNFVSHLTALARRYPGGTLPGA
jgi:hypothetical protein